MLVACVLEWHASKQCTSHGNCWWCGTRLHVAVAEGNPIQPSSARHTPAELVMHLQKQLYLAFRASGACPPELVHAFDRCMLCLS